MKKAYFGVILALLLAGSALAQPVGSIGLYADPDGTVDLAEGWGYWYPHPTNNFLDVYVVIFWENMIGGASYAITPLPPGITLVAEAFEEGVSIGSAFDGCGVEFGFSQPQFGFMGTPVLVCTITVLSLTGPADLSLFVLNHCNYATPVLADRYAEIFEAEGRGLVVPTESNSWGAVKNLYR